MLLCSKNLWQCLLVAEIKSIPKKPNLYIARNSFCWAIPWSSFRWEMMRANLRCTPLSECKSWRRNAVIAWPRSAHLRVNIWVNLCCSFRYREVSKFWELPVCDKQMSQYCALGLKMFSLLSNASVKATIIAVSLRSPIQWEHSQRSKFGNECS